MTIPPLLCEHPPGGIRRRAYRAECGACGSYWDLESLNAHVEYDASYPEMRGHFDPRVGALKVRTLRHWLRRTNVTLDGKTVCEVGFGGGTCLPFLAEHASHLVGLEVNQSAIDRVRDTGIRAELLRVDPLPTPSRAIDLWIFQDSFEHIPQPAPFVEWMNAHSAPAAEILVVLPRGDAVSRRMMGRMWPHKLPDHQFQWSRAGLLEFMERAGWEVRTDFFALKFVSPQMLVAHALHHAGAPPRVRRWLGGAAFALPFNFGEMGLVFRRRV
jgi:SAM-dependent methyltransferase